MQRDPENPLLIRGAVRVLQTDYGMLVLSERNIKDLDALRSPTGRIPRKGSAKRAEWDLIERELTEAVKRRFMGDEDAA